MATKLIFGILFFFTFHSCIEVATARRCASYCDDKDQLRNRFYCSGDTPDCCGTVRDRYCCKNATHNFNNERDRYYCTSVWWIEHWRMITYTFGGVVACLICAACCFHCCAGCCKNNHTTLLPFRRQARNTNSDENELESGPPAPDRAPSMIFNPMSPTAFIPPEYAKDPPKYTELFGADGNINPSFVQDVGEASQGIRDPIPVPTVPIPTDPVPSYEESAQAAEASQNANAGNNQVSVTVTVNPNASRSNNDPVTNANDEDEGITLTVPQSGGTNESANATVTIPVQSEQASNISVTNTEPVTIQVQAAPSSDTHQYEELGSGQQTAPSSDANQDENIQLPGAASINSQQSVESDGMVKDQAITATVESSALGGQQTNDTMVQANKDKKI